MNVAQPGGLKSVSLLPSGSWRPDGPGPGSSRTFPLKNRLVGVMLCEMLFLYSEFCETVPVNDLKS